VRQPSKKSKGKFPCSAPSGAEVYSRRTTSSSGYRPCPGSCEMPPQVFRRGHSAWVEELSHPPGNGSRLIFPGWLPFGGIWQWDFVKPAVRAWENPTGRLHSERASRGNPRFEDPHPWFRVGLSRIASPRLSPECFSSLFVSGRRAVFPATGW
jgi:hypothetical protein